MFRIPMFGFALLIFVFLAVILAIAVFFAFKSGAQGKTKLGGFAGCMVALALLFIAGVAGIALVILSLMSIPSEAVRHGPVKSFEFQWRDNSPEPSDPHAESPSPVHGRIELHGVVDATPVLKWLREKTDPSTHLAVREDKDADGQACTVIELTRPMDQGEREEWRQMWRDLEKSMPDFRFPTGVRIVLRGPDE